MTDVYEGLLRRLADLERDVAQLKVLERPKVAWTDWTPTVMQSGAVTATVNYAKYGKVGGIMHVIAHLSITGAGTANNTVLIGGFVATMTPAANTNILGLGKILDTGNKYYVGAVEWAGTAVQLLAHNAGSPIGIDPNFALANGDDIHLNLMYPVA